MNIYDYVFDRLKKREGGSDSILEGHSFEMRSLSTLMPEDPKKLKEVILALRKINETSLTVAYNVLPSIDGETVLPIWTLSEELTERVRTDLLLLKRGKSNIYLVQSPNKYKLITRISSPRNKLTHFEERPDVFDSDEEAQILANEMIDFYLDGSF